MVQDTHKNFYIDSTLPGASDVEWDYTCQENVEYEQLRYRQRGHLAWKKTSYSCAVKPLVQNVLTIMINRCKIYFVGFIFMVYANHKNIFSYTCLPRYINNQLFLNQCKKQSLVLVTSETWLDSTITDSVVALPGHDIQCRDRNRKGGGVMVYVNHYGVAGEGWTLKMMMHYGLKLGQ